MNYSKWYLTGSLSECTSKCVTDNKCAAITFDISNNSKGPNTHDGERIDMGEPSRSGKYSLANCYFYRKESPKAPLKLNKNFSSCYKDLSFVKRVHIFIATSAMRPTQTSIIENPTIKLNSISTVCIANTFVLFTSIIIVVIAHWVFKVLFLIFWWERRRNKKGYFYSATRLKYFL
jgi:hypothetical protein